MRRTAAAPDRPRVAIERLGAAAWADAGTVGARLRRPRRHVERGPVRGPRTGVRNAGRGSLLGLRRSPEHAAGPGRRRRPGRPGTGRLERCGARQRHSADRRLARGAGRAPAAWVGLLARRGTAPTELRTIRARARRVGTDRRWLHTLHRNG